MSTPVDQAVGRRVGEHVVERARASRRRCSSPRRGSSVDSQVRRSRVVVEDLHRVLLRVGVEVAGQEDRVDAARGREVVGEGRSACACAIRSGLAPGPGRCRRRRREPLDLKWLTMTAKPSASSRTDRLEGLGERLARVGERGAAEQDVGRRRPGRPFGRLVDEAGADHVLLGDGPAGRASAGRLDEVPGAGAGVGVERVDERGERLVAVGLPSTFGCSRSPRATRCRRRAVLIALTILACWRWKLAAFHAPRGPLPVAGVHRDRVAVAVDERRAGCPGPAS